MDIFMQIMWFGTGIAIIIAGVLADRSRLARYVGGLGCLCSSPSPAR